MQVQRLEAEMKLKETQWAAERQQARQEVRVCIDLAASSDYLDLCLVVNFIIHDCSFLLAVRGAAGCCPE